jgi:hypothetical protein
VVELGFGEVGIAFDFLNLLGVAFAVRADEKDEFVGIPFPSDGAVDGVVAESGSVFEKFLRVGAALDEVVDGTLWRSEAVGGLERIRSLNFGGTVRDAGQNAGVDHSDVAAGSGGGDHHFFNDHATDKIFGGSSRYDADSEAPAEARR